MGRFLFGLVVCTGKMIFINCMYKKNRMDNRTSAAGPIAANPFRRAYRARFKRVLFVGQFFGHLDQGVGLLHGFRVPDDEH